MSKGKLRAIKLLNVKSKRPAMICVYRTEAGLRRRQVVPAEGQSLKEALRGLADPPQQ